MLPHSCPANRLARLLPAGSGYGTCHSCTRSTVFPWCFQGVWFRASIGETFLTISHHVRQVHHPNIRKSRTRSKNRNMDRGQRTWTSKGLDFVRVWSGSESSSDVLLSGFAPLFWTLSDFLSPMLQGPQEVFPSIVPAKSHPLTSKPPSTFTVGVLHPTLDPTPLLLLRLLPRRRS